MRACFVCCTLSADVALCLCSSSSLTTTAAPLSSCGASAMWQTERSCCLCCLQVAFDPLDGSSIVGANFAVGSIFGIWPGDELIGRKGSEQAAAVYAVYGPRTVLVVAWPHKRGGQCKVLCIVDIQIDCWYCCYHLLFICHIWSICHM